MPRSCAPTLLLPLLLAACGPEQIPPPPPPAPAGTLGVNDRVLALQNRLREVSGITFDGGAHLVCVQDEDGALFEIDTTSGKVAARHPFGAPGDYEDVVAVGDGWFVLRSDGLLLQLRRQDGGLGIVAQHALDLGHREFESLCHDAARHRLLIAPKDPGKRRKAERGNRPIYAFDLATAKVADEPLFELRSDEIERVAAAAGRPLPVRVTDKGKEKSDLALRISALAMRPGTDRVFVLSSVDRLLVVCDLTGAVHEVHSFTADELPQPEGLAFEDRDHLWVSSEGSGQRALLRRYRLQP